MKIQILGAGCATCKNLHKAVKEIIKKLQLDIEVQYSTDIAKIVELGAMSSPVLAIDGNLITSGKVPTNEEIERVILSFQKGKSAEINQSSKGACSCGGKY